MYAVAVEPALSHIRDYLQAQGCPCVGIHNGKPERADVCAIVINGTDRNLMGMQDVVYDVPVIDAAGLTPEQVFQRIQPYIH
ncbi:hypothetical protein GCM10010885_13010 [Alicyclobacillus cellulosilyticus]|uniref:YkuS family protein n=1 Tax=Alicyclobacillus cellulosilyticus TaxID=1003997 RepID=A0A917NJI4_9BACL|nr:YkuS family protein [Alicyclobacillus cellulosilyticus]GGJ05332.1 hypothetical protein GCM10010885_13010 [Alicyclobacillus cellulosilyticus]